ncbi:hypothetical protein KZZ52_08900 [Dactylosporangium sp. AC04546]|uniref:hypothetical protein n=1 Tax=Dactylosporangium sp. AC04546 TaxID=2862460 RepID=UPI001EDEE2FE|nr:hypothetical protein [Dactylosporangium sp. AC04546]WVK85486.1 hypothetical protein KZZ52_08900 [Dactylosporangium sp. AC04546]
MALVRRTNVLGSNPNRVVAAATVAPAPQAVGRAQVPQPGTIPAQPGPVDPGVVAPGFAEGEIGAAVAVAGGEVPAPGGEAAAVPPQQASIGALISAFLLVAAGGAVSWAFYHYKINAAAIRLPDATTIFAALFAFATAVERVLEPFARFMPGRHARGELEKAVANMANKYHDATLDDLIQVAHAKSMVEKGRASRGLVSWGIATALATVASSAGGLYLLHAMAGDGWNGIPVWVDAIVTGIVVGSGTKPLHDVISKVQKNKEKSEDASA